MLQISNQIEQLILKAMENWKLEFIAEQSLTKVNIRRIFSGDGIFQQWDNVIPQSYFMTLWQNIYTLYEAIKRVI